jgi:hypothetical protein
MTTFIRLTIINYLKTDNTTKASHLGLGNVMFRVTWQTRIVDTCNLGPRDRLFSKQNKHKRLVLCSLNYK